MRRGIVNARYPEDTHPEWLNESHAQDRVSIGLLEDLANRSSIWKRKYILKHANLVAMILSGYFAIKERGAYLAALSPNAGIDELMWSLKNSGPDLPKQIREEIKEIWENDNGATYIGEDLECLGILYNVDAPQLPDILAKRKEYEEKRKARARELYELAALTMQKKPRTELKMTKMWFPLKEIHPRSAETHRAPAAAAKNLKNDRKLRRAWFLFTRVPTKPKLRA